MAKKNDSDDLVDILSSLSEGVSKINKAMDGRVIIEKSQFVDSSVPIELNRLSPDKSAAINEDDYLNARKSSKLSQKHIERIARDYIEEKSNGIVEIDPEE